MHTKIIRSVSAFFKSVFVDKYSPAALQNNAGLSNVPEIPKYPPIDQGIILYSIHSLIDTQKELISRIQNAAGLPPKDFEERFFQVIVNISKYVHLLPATRTGHHRGAGGLFRLSLEMGLYSLQAANSTIFINKGAASAEVRYKLQPRWVFATFIAGVCSELYRPLTNMIVTDEGGNKWPQLLITLYDWMSSKPNERFYVNWNIQDESTVIATHQATAAYILNSVVPMVAMQYLNEENTEIVSTVTASITNNVPIGTRNQVHQIVALVRKKVIERDLKRNSQMYGDFSVGTHLEPHLVDAMRQLIRKKTWELNVKGARIWYSKEGMFIVWQPAAREIIGLLREENQPGIPSEPDTLADILISCGIAEQNDEDGRYWEICIPQSMQILSAIKLQRMELLFNDPVVLESMLFEGSFLPKNITPKVADVSAKLASKKRKSKAEAVETVEETNLVLVNPVVLSELLPVVEIPLIQEELKLTETKETQQLGNLENDNPQVAVDCLKSQNEILETPQGRNEETAPRVDGDESSARIFKSLPTDIADVLQAIVEDHQDGSSSGPVFYTADGVAISTVELESHGQSGFAGLVKALSDKSWLWVDHDKPLRKIFTISHNDKANQCIVIRKEIARGMGIDWRAPKKGGLK